jgi:Acyclic terpene utilisation family protein AtuA
MKEIKLFGPFGNLGYGGVTEEVWEKTMAWNPDLIFQQGTSSDPGPGYLGTDTSYADRAGIKHDLQRMISSAQKLGVPFIGSLGGGGSNKALEWNLEIIDEIARENHLRFKAAVISSEVDKEFIKEKLRRGAKAKAVDPHFKLPEYLTPKMVDESKVIVAQMGPEPIMNALDLDVQMVLTGRANDTSLPLAFALKKGFPKGLSLQMAKVVECSGWAVLRDDHILFPSLDPDKERFKSALGIISHGVFYERRDPTRPEYMPGGHLDITNARWEQLEGLTTKACGGVWVDDPYRVKLEGVRRIGYRSICLAGMRDPWLISKVEDGSYLKMAEQTARNKITAAGIPPGDYQIHYKVYGRDGVMGDLEPQKKITAHELGFIIDVIGKTPEISKTVCMFARLQMLHLPYPGRLTTAGNVAIAFSPSDIHVGEAYVFNIWHLLPLEGEEIHRIFKTRVEEFPRTRGGGQ